MAESSDPPRCPCGFWGSSQTNGLCSKCFKDIGGSMKVTSKADDRKLLVDKTDGSSEASASCVTADTDTAQYSVDISENTDTNTTDSVKTDKSEPDSATGSQSDTKQAESQQEQNSESSGVKRDFSEVSQENTDDSKQKKKKRCHKCNCRLELAQRELGKCRCENVFCLLHRHPEAHDCEFDHKETGRAQAREKIVKPTRHVGTSVRRLDSDT